MDIEYMKESIDELLKANEKLRTQLAKLQSRINNGIRVNVTTLSTGRLIVLPCDHTEIRNGTLLLDEQGEE